MKKCEWPDCKRDAEHEVNKRGATTAPLNLCGTHRIEYLRNGLEQSDGKGPKASGQAGKGKTVVPAVSEDDSG